jgi:hypothetical protein
MLKEQFVEVKVRETVRVCWVVEGAEALKLDVFQAVKMPPDAPIAGLLQQPSRRRGRKVWRLRGGISESFVS